MPTPKDFIPDELTDASERDLVEIAHREADPGSRWYHVYVDEVSRLLLKRLADALDQALDAAAAVMARAEDVVDAWDYPGDDPVRMAQAINALRLSTTAPQGDVEPAMDMDYAKFPWTQPTVPGCACAGLNPSERGTTCGEPSVSGSPYCADCITGRCQVFRLGGLAALEAFDASVPESGAGE